MVSLDGMPAQQYVLLVYMTPDPQHTHTHIHTQEKKKKRKNQCVVVHSITCKLLSNPVPR